MRIIAKFLGGIQGDSMKQCRLSGLCSAWDTEIIQCILASITIASWELGLGDWYQMYVQAWTERRSVRGSKTPFSDYSRVLTKMNLANAGTFDHNIYHLLLEQRRTDNAVWRSVSFLWNKVDGCYKFFSNLLHYQISGALQKNRYFLFSEKFYSVPMD